MHFIAHVVNGGAEFLKNQTRHVYFQRVQIRHLVVIVKKYKVSEEIFNRSKLVQ